MANYDLSDAASSQPAAGARVPGARRQKVLGYLKAANELRQTYQAQVQQRSQGDNDENGIPGAFPDVEIVRSGDEEMVLFPSYARKHIKKHPATLPGAPRDIPGSNDDIENPESGDAEYWKRQWEKYEDDNAVVDVDVRGWIYSPHREPINRKNRLLVAVARKLSGIPAPEASPSSSSQPSTEHLSHAEHVEERTSRHEDEAAAKAAQSIIKKGEEEVKIAWRGGYSEDPKKGYDTDSPKTNNSRSVSPFGSLESVPGPRPLRHSLTDTEVASEDEDPGLKSLQTRKSWNQPAAMSKEELAQANAHLMARLRPFMTLPLANTPITIFFFNDNKSQSRSVHTDESGHFNVRASLDFVPSAIRVLASEKLSATEKVIITEEKGISLVSDIDDTIKHSAIASGAREIFKNTFIRELGDLTIPGVKEWYSKMSEMGVKLHFVSNSPWQLYPVLRSYFALAGLPAGSFHLKQYSGMLQGIFEPAAERKRGSLERIMRDFPERKFILVGDSGEADLEVYSDVVSENPGRILAVFIRDVTTPEKKKFFDQAVSDGKSDSKTPPRNGSHTSEPFSPSDAPEDRPRLPRRANTANVQDLPEADLIDFDDEPQPAKDGRSHSHNTDLLELQRGEHARHKPVPPARPSKPASLRGKIADPEGPMNQDRKAGSISVAPDDISSPSPKPGRSSEMADLPSTAAHTQSPLPRRLPLASDQQNQSRPPLPTHTSSSSTIRSLRPHLHSRKTTNSKLPITPNTPQPDFYAPDYRAAEDPGEGFAALARRQINTAYNALPSIRSVSPAREYDSHSSGAPPPRRGLTSYPAAATRWATGATGGDPAAGGDGGALPGASYNKKEEMWKRRWARAEELMHSHRVVLRSWRVGGDVMDDCVRLVQKGMEDLERESGRRGGVSLTGSKAYRASTGDQ